MLLGNVFQQMYNIVDSIIVGKVLGDEALAAVGANFPFIFALISFVVGIAIGATVIISQYYGAKQMDNVKKTIDTLYIFMFFASVFITTVGILMSGWIFQIIDLPNSVKPMAIEYFKVYAIGFIFFFGFQGTSAILRGLGDSKTPVYFLIISTIMNIALDILFVVVFKWGIEGVAAATVISQAGAFFTIIWYLNRYHSFMDFSPSKMRFKNRITIWRSANICIIRFPCTLQNCKHFWCTYHRCLHHCHENRFICCDACNEFFSCNFNICWSKYRCK